MENECEEHSRIFQSVIVSMEVLQYTSQSLQNKATVQYCKKLICQFVSFQTCKKHLSPSITVGRFFPITIIYSNIKYICTRL